MSYFPRIKICGITCVQQAVEIANLGVDALGLIVGAESPRQITLSQADQIIKALPPFITKVALVVNQPHAHIHNIINQLDIDLIQFHGDESAEFCNQFNFPYIRCLRVATDEKNIPKEIANIHNQGAIGVLLDAWDKDQYGGTGKQINAKFSLKDIQSPVILAGGINADNAVQKLIDFQPYAIDVNSGVESAPGKKNINQIQQLMKNIHHYCQKIQ